MILAATPSLLPATPAHALFPGGQTSAPQVTEAGDGPFEEAERLFRERNFPAAEPLFRRITETSPHYPKAQLRLGTIYYAVGQPELAEGFLRTHLRYQESPEAHTLLAGVQLNQGKFEPAIESARKAIALDNRYARAHTALGMIYATVEDFPKALSAFRTALELDDEDANTWFLLGRSYFLSHQPGMAKEALEKRSEPQSAGGRDLCAFGANPGPDGRIRPGCEGCSSKASRETASGPLRTRGFTSLSGCFSPGWTERMRVVSSSEP